MPIARPIPRHLLDAGDDLSAPVEIYARHLQCSPPGESPTWKLGSPTLPEKGGTSSNPESTAIFSNFELSMPTTWSVQVKLELGHKATTRKKPTPEGFTHDWQMFVRGPEGSNIQHFVDRVIFHLHDSFPKPKRVVKEPPYMINESGYAGFNLPIEIYFKNKEEPKKIIFNYDLFLHTPNSPPVNHVRCEKLTFQNPTEEFRRKLIKAGGIGIPGPNEQSMAVQQTTEVKCSSSPPATQLPDPSNKTFVDLFGAPLKADNGHKKHKGHSSKEKTGGKGKSVANLPASSSPAEASTPPSTYNTNSTTPPSTPSKDNSSKNTPTKHSKEKSSKRPAENSPPSENSKKKRKEPPPMVDDVIRAKERSDKKERDKREKDRDEKEKKDKERRKEKKSSSKDSKGKHKSSKKESSKSSKAISGGEPKPSKGKTPPRVSPPILPPVPPLELLPPATAPDPSRSAPAKKARRDEDELSVCDMLTPFDESLDGILPSELLAPYVGVGGCSPASTLSFSSLKETAGGGGSGPLGALLAEMEDEEEPLSPLPITETSPPHRIPPPLIEDKPDKPIRQTEPTTKDTAPPVAPETKTSGGKAKRKDRESRKSRSDRRTKEASKENKESVKEANKMKEAIAKDLFREHNSEKDTEMDTRVSNIGESDLDFTDNSTLPASLQTATAPNGESLNVLLEIQRRLMAMTDRDLVQKVVNVIEETGMYKISDATFDFDLCSLDSNTVKKLQVCLEMQVC